MKHFVIVDHKAHVLANKLWSDLSVRAAGYEYGARVWNVALLERGWTGWLHKPLSRLFEALSRGSSLWALGAPKALSGGDMLRTQSTVFFFGWLFRDLTLMEKHRAPLVAQAFSPEVQRQATRRLDGTIDKVRIGIRHRTRPFTGFVHDEYLVSRSRVDQIVAEYIERRGLTREQVTLIEVIDDVEKDDMVGLCVISQSAVVIGDNSTFSNVAAWLGNVPHVVVGEDPIDWEYYQGKDHYFENKYATFTYGSTKPEFA